MTRSVDIAALPPVPDSPLPYRRRLNAIRAYSTGAEVLRDAGGSVTRCWLAPRWVMPPVAVVTSPQGARDVLGRTDGRIEKALPIYDELRRVIGGNVFVFRQAAWLPRRRALQPVFTKHHVTQFSGHMAAAAEQMCLRWPDNYEIDLAAECRKLTLRALGHSVLGVDLGDRAAAVEHAIGSALKYCADRAWRPLRAPSWLPTPARRRARKANLEVHRLAAEILRTCRADPTVDAPLVRTLIGAVDPDSGKMLSDKEICDELVLFILAGHDTTSTTLTYAFWALGRHPEIQERVAAEVAALGQHPLTPADVAQLPYTVQVLNESLRLCPPGASNPRMVMADVDIDGYRVESGTVAMVGIYAMHRDPALWDNALQFEALGVLRAESIRVVTAGSSCRSAVGRAAAWVTTSPCWRRPWRWQPPSVS